MLHPVLPVKPICGVMMAEGVVPYPIFKKLEALLGPIEDHSKTFDFDFSPYYREEMGDLVKKCWVSFRRLIMPDRLPEIKHATQELERNWSVSGKRRINLDPGYVNAAKVVLASTKDFAHRIYLSHHIYGDVQLRFIHRAFRPSEWTYPDYRTEIAMAFFTRVRNRYLTQEKAP